MLNIGTISHGTMRTQDLLVSFAEAYKQYCSGPSFDGLLWAEAQGYASLLKHENVSDDCWYRAHGVLDDLFDRLDELAGRYDCYFGTTEGDGSDFGFWPIADDE